METEQFEDENEAKRYIVARLGEDLPQDLAAGVMDLFAVYCGVEGVLDDWPRTAVGHGVRGGEGEIGAPFFGPWTVREQELRDLKEIAIGCLATYFHPKEVGAIVPIIISAACMVWRLRRRGVSVNPLQRAILVSLRTDGAQQLQALAHRASSFGTEWTKTEVEGALKELGAIRLNDGTVVPLVHRDSDEMWSTDARGLWEVPFGSSG